MAQLKEPVRKTDEQIRSLAKRRKNRMLREMKSVKGGNFNSVVAQFRDFAIQHNVDINDVKYTKEYYGGYLVTNVPETDEQKFKRLRKDADEKYRYDLDAYRRQQRAIEAERQRVIERASNVGLTVCCSHCPACKRR